MENIETVAQLKAALSGLAREMLESGAYKFNVKIGLEEIVLDRGTDCESGWLNFTTIGIYDHIVRKIFAHFEINSYFDLLDAIDPEPEIRILTCN